MKTKYFIFTMIMLVGLALFIVGLAIEVPGDKLTTYYVLADESEYSYIKEYVNGDAYNYIIGASLVGGRIAGVLAQKAIFIAIGLLIFSIGIYALLNVRMKENVDKKEENMADCEKSNLI